MQFLRDIYAQYSDFSVTRLNHWYLGHLFSVPEADGGHRDYDRLVQAIREAVEKEPLSKRREYQLQEESLVTLILTKYEQSLLEMEEADRLGDTWLRDFLKVEVVDYFRKGLLRNPRVLNYWDNVKQLFSERLRKDVAEQLDDGTATRDETGPFVSPLRPQASTKLSDLNEEFRANYRTAKAQALKRAKYVIVVEGDEVVLLHQGQRTVEQYTPEVYHTLKSVAHLPLGVYVRLSEHADSDLPDVVIEALSRTRKVIQAARHKIGQVGLSERQIARQVKMLDASETLISSAIQARRVERGRLRSYVHEMVHLVMENTDEAAHAQLDRLHAVIGKWRNEHGKGLLEQAHVIVMGPQAPRRGNLAVQYFARLLNQGGEGYRLLYSEAIFEEPRALDLLATRLVDDSASEAFFGDRNRLQVDLLADAAERHLRTLFPK
jgi:hypothetical protein